MGYIFSVNIYSSDKMFSLAELSTITVDPSESNPTCYEDSTIEESMCNILSFGILQKIKGLFLVWPLGGLFLASHLGLLEFEFYLLVLHFCLEKPVVGTLSHLILTLSSLDILCKNTPPNIRTIAETNKIRLKIHLEASSLF